MNKVYSDRAITTPSTLIDFIKASIQTMSAHLVRQGYLVGDTMLPKEALFQHLLMTTMTKNSDRCVTIIPELSASVPFLDDPNPPRKIAGEVDFLLLRDNPDDPPSFKWGIELLVEGRGVTEHISRFDKGGKYAPLGCTDHIVVDFRLSADGKPTNVTPHPNRFTVFFQAGGTFRTCVCVDRMEANLLYLNLLDDAL